jgi:hypothetical protein
LSHFLLHLGAYNYANTPADDYWTLFFEYNVPGEIFERGIPITFLPTMEIDSTRTSTQNLVDVSNLLSPSISLIQAATGDETFDIFDTLKLLNWIVVSYYWLFLYDFGQLAPLQYNVTGWIPNFTQPYIFSSTNNIFVNETLFDIYSSYMRNTLFPYLNAFETMIGAPNLVLPEFMPLSPNNTLQKMNVTFLRSYSCLERHLFGWGTVLVSVFVADYAFITGAYLAVMFIAGWWQTRGKPEGKSHLRQS